MRPRSTFPGAITTLRSATKRTSRACWTFWPDGHDGSGQETRMTRLDSAIRRLTAQRDLLDWAAQNVGPAGLVLEIGLGNGRTYDHLRAKLPGREIHVFERSPAAHPDCIPPDSRLVVGDIFETLPLFTERFGSGSAALIHVDIGTGDEEANRGL